VTTRTASYLRDSYKEIEMRLLQALGQLPGILLDQAKQAILSSEGAPAVSLLERYVKLRNSRSRNNSSQRGFPFSWEISLDLMEDEKLLKKTLTLPESLRILELLHITEGSSYRLAEFAKHLHKLEYSQTSDFDRLILKSNLLSSDALGSYANFLTYVCGRHDEAELFYKRALDADPKHATNLGNYAIFLTDVREQHHEAESFYKRSLDSDPKHVNNLGNYANFLTVVREQHDEAESFYKRSLDSDPKNANTLSNYAHFLTDIRERHDEAELFYKRALDVDPKHTNNLGNYGQFLIGKGETHQGLALLHSAWRHKSKLPNQGVAELAFSPWLCNQLAETDGLAWENAFKHLIRTGFRRPKWNFDTMLKQAESKLNPATLKYAKALADAFLDEKKVAALDQFARWKKLQPVDPKLVE